MVENVHGVILAPLVRSAVTLDEASAQRNLMGHLPVRAGGRFYRTEPALDQRLLLAIASAAPTQRFETGERAQRQESSDAVGTKPQRQRERRLASPLSIQFDVCTVLVIGESIDTESDDVARRRREFHVVSAPRFRGGRVAGTQRLYVYDTGFPLARE